MTALQIIKLLKQDGWFQIAQKGSHKQFKHNTKKGIVTVPYHSNVDLHVAVIKSIEKQAKIKILNK
ncbi:type II toxin-antitoxin system HicA family toxin [Brachyspira pilosicoli]|uniref:type II toxin-antitoxin system HicA family toxin n=1 Tax=Brachyspira pilosicoli TaxID=52584 RepID=UPI001CA5E513|nr:type II toxin-antitoxin system HicA family toxin [Brachyspira pilosicoli]MBW5383881.1 addiction module toxin, HicA family [Brachyspira pilosicoli]